MAQTQVKSLGRSVLDELLVEGSSKDGTFYEYKAPIETGEKILNELYARFDFKTGFRMDDNSNEVGLLSQCQSLQALLLLTSEFSLLFDEEGYFEDDRTFADGTKPTIRRIMDNVIEDIVSRIIRYNGKKIDNVNMLENHQLPEGFLEKATFCFDASPYDSTSFSAEFSYIDSITWVIPTFLLVLKYHARQVREDCKWERCLVAIIKHGLRYINDAFIVDKEKLQNLDTAKRLEIGWNFTQKCEEPSLYFTFAVCECYVDFYETFKNHIDYEFALYKKRKYDIPVPTAVKKAYNEQSKDRREVKLRELFETINFGDSSVYSFNDEGDEIASVYGQLELNCKLVANKIWELTKNGLADKFFYNDLGSTLDEETIKMSTTSDALFNSVYIVNIIIDAGIDEDLIMKMEDANESRRFGDVKKLQEEYDELFEVCQLAIQRAIRTYEKLQKDSKEYIVDQFLVGFNENFVVHNDLIKDLRKRRMRVFSLAPLLIHSNNVIGEYLIRYPQYNMKKYVTYILENRLVETDPKTGEQVTKWIWETDGFFSASNYYYISALGEFYRYYNTFEKVYLDISKQNEATIKDIREEYFKELETTGEIARQQNEIEQKELEIETLRQEKDAIKKPIEDAVVQMISETLKEQLPTMLLEVLTSEREALKERTALKPTDNRRKLTSITEALDDLLLEMVAFDGNADNKTLREDTKEDARALIKKEIARIRGKLADAVMFSDEHQSGLF
ncbi:MAG: hypothetical protein IKD04_05790 [Clostridia bacterium]|nr:hypothetical protein [Clostridia bacterium]